MFETVNRGDFERGRPAPAPHAGMAADGPVVCRIPARSGVPLPQLGLNSNFALTGAFLPRLIRTTME